MSVYPDGVDVSRSAVLSDDRVYRYRLERRWGPGALLAFIGLNPSTADATLDDPTIRRCVGFARSHGYNGLAMLNLYAYRATKPRDLWKVDDPVGPENDAYLTHEMRRAEYDHRPVIACWGGNAKMGRVTEVARMPGFTSLHSLAQTAYGMPSHPLYLPGDSRAKKWHL